jgi:hypothetical protein
MKSELKRRPRTVIFRVLILAVVLIGLSQYQSIIDAYALATYTPPADIAALEAPLGLTRSSLALVARTRPVIDGKTQFNHDCQTQVGELELGCYVGGRIYILKLDNASLRAEMETVLAHELLHAAWLRMSGSERSSEGVALEATYHSLSNAELSQRMADYAKSEPGQETNELHSIIGTEQPTISASLEAHYARYFTNRGTIVAAHQAYNAVFSQSGAQLATQLANIKALKAQLSRLNARMASYEANGQISQYNALVASQNALVNQVNALITQYDAAVAEYNALSKSIDSRQVDTEPGV